MLTRQDFAADHLARLVGKARTLPLLSEEQLDQSRTEALRARQASAIPWVSGTASLMRNPARITAESRPARAEAYCRSCSLEVTLGRGTPPNPGLLLGPVRGEQCAGIAHRIAASDMEGETTIPWRREMPFGAYWAVWLPLDLEDGRIEGLTFVLNTAHTAISRICRWQARRIADAQGVLGTNGEYLFRTCAALDDVGLHDGYVDQLCRAVREIRATESGWTTTRRELRNH